MADVLSSAGTGYIEYEAEVVRTTRKANRGFERARKADIDLRIDFAGAAAAFWESVEEASGGRGTSAASAFNLFRRRCGGSSAGGVWLAMFIEREGVVSDPLSLASSAACTSRDASHPSCLAFLRAFVQKNVLSTFSSRATALWTLRGVEWKARVGGDFASLRAHRAHIAPPSRDRRSAVVGGRRSMRGRREWSCVVLHWEKHRSSDSMA